MDLFAAGAETTSTTISWICLYMARNQHVQERLAQEIAEVVGSSRLPSLADRHNMPYTEAVLLEVMRKVTLAPLGVMRTATQGTTFHGYQITKGTIIWPNIYEMHYNVQLWGDPENFRPDRFLPKEGGRVVMDCFMPFGWGKRVCPGESLARDELFLFATALFQEFKVNYDPSAPPPTLEPNNARIMIPKPHKLVLELRNV